MGPCEGQVAASHLALGMPLVALGHREVEVPLGHHVVEVPPLGRRIRHRARRTHPRHGRVGGHRGAEQVATPRHREGV